jgi:flagellum-specific peptidoglycan hydrolase FlgJ
MTREDFTTKFYQLAKGVTDGTGVFPETLLAMAIVESRTGDSLLSKKYNNYFGIKSAGKWKGASVNLKTQEFYSATPTTITDAFRAYPSVKAGFKDYVNFLKVNSRYAKALKAPTYQEQIIEIARAGYATAPNYADIITSVADKVKDLIPLAAKVIKGNQNKLIFLGLGLLTFTYLALNKNGKKIYN